MGKESKYKKEDWFRKCWTCGRKSKRHHTGSFVSATPIIICPNCGKKTFKKFEW